MAETTYTYSISTGTANGKVVASKLEREILDDSVITIAVKQIDTNGDVLDITMKDALAVAEKTQLDTVVLNHDGVAPTTVRAVRIQPQKDPTRGLVLHGEKFTATLNTTTEHDVTFTEERELEGAWCEIQDHTEGDYIELEIHHPVAGLLGVFAETVFVPPDGQLPPVVSDGTETIPAGLIIKFKYVSVATTGNQPVIYCYLRTHK